MLLSLTANMQVFSRVSSCLIKPNLSLENTHVGPGLVCTPSIFCGMDSANGLQMDSTHSLLYACAVQVRHYVEFHLEQGPQLEASGLALGVVSGIAGQTWLHIAVEGVQNHGGEGRAAASRLR